MRDTASTQARIAWLSERLEQITYSKNELFRQLAELNMEFTEKQHEQKSLQNSIAPISSLPNELLAHIFNIGHHALPHLRVPFEILVSHVNHHWRKVALGNVTIWARIRRHEFQRRLEPIALYLQRSQQIPIHLVIHIGYEVRDRSDTDESVEDESEWEDISPFCRMIEPHLPRCCRLAIRSANSAENSKILRCLISIRTPILWSIDLSLSMDHHHQEPLRILEGGAPSLTHVFLDGVMMVNCLASTTALHLDLEYWPRSQSEYKELSSILSGIPSLAHLEFMHALRWPSDVPMLLPALRMISYRTINLKHISRLLTTLTAPLLRDMIIYLGRDGTELDESVALNGPFNFPSLQRLSLHIPSGVPSSEIRKFSRAFPYLVDIVFAGYTNASYHVDQMLAVTEEDRTTHGGVGLWPNLQTLTISFPRFDYFPTASIQTFLAHRATMGLPIRTLLLPEIHLAQAPELSSCTQPAVTIAEYMGIGKEPSPFPEGNS